MPSLVLSYASLSSKRSGAYFFTVVKCGDKCPLNQQKFYNYNPLCTFVFIIRINIIVISIIIRINIVITIDNMINDHLVSVSQQDVNVCI